MELAGNSRRGNRDMISAMKDEELHPIMSFLTAKEAVQTCILSKLSCMDTGDDDEQFINSVNTTLLLRGPADVQTFRLSCQYLPRSRSNYVMAIRSWILYVLKHNPKKFDIRVPETVELPMSVFTCSSLEDVYLSNIRFPYAGVIELPRLKRLHLRDIVVDQDFVEKLFCGCPVLESLVLDGCKLQLSTIISQSLKYLDVVTNCDEIGPAQKTIGLIDAPNLLSFYFGDCPNYFEHRTVLHTPSLTDATLCLSSCCSSQFNYRKINLLVGISNIENLQLSITKEILENELLGCPKFSNLKDLFVDEICLSCHFNLLASFIDRIPNLEKLSLVHHGCRCEMSKEHGNRESLKISPFQCKQLKTLKVQTCKNDEDLPSFWNYLHRSVLNLKVHISMSSSLEEWCPAWRGPLCL